MTDLGMMSYNRKYSIPKLDGSIDLTNFDSKYTSEEVATSDISQGGLDLIKTNQELFEDF